MVTELKPVLKNLMHFLPCAVYLDSLQFKAFCCQDLNYFQAAETAFLKVATDTHCLKAHSTTGIG